MNAAFIEKITALQDNNFVILRSCRSAYEGKLLAKLAEGRTRVDMAQLKLRLQTRRDGTGLIQSLPLPVYVENLQYAPKLLVQLAQLPPGSVLASCRQSCVLEQEGARLPIVKFIILPLAGAQAELPAAKMRTEETVWQQLFQGQWRGEEAMGYEEYLRELLQADVVEVTTVRDGFKFFDYLMAAALMAGESVDFVQLAQTAAIKVPMAKNWLKVLLGTGLCYLQQVEQGGEPRLYFRDTGLLCHLLGLADVQAAAHSAQREQLLQNFYVNQWREAYLQEGSQPPQICPVVYNF